MAQTARFRCRASSMVWIVVTLTALCAVGSLALDYARVQLAKTELRRAADAAARAAVSAISDPAAATQLALDYAKANQVDGQDVALVAAEDVKFVNWDGGSRTYEELSGTARANANAILVTARRTAQRNNAVPLMLGALIGQRTCDVNATAIASINAINYGVIGLNWINMSGNSTDSYWSSGGSFIPGGMGNIASNGNITLKGAARIHGDVRTYGGTISGGTITGTQGTLPAPLNFPTSDAGSNATVNDNGRIPNWALNGARDSLTLGKNKNLPLPGGVYYLKDLYTTTGSILSFSGPTTIYCWGNLSLNAQANTLSNIPGNLKIFMCPGPAGQPPGSVSISAGSALYASIYAPQSPVSFTGSGALYGWVVGQSIDMTGGSAIHYDLALTGKGEITIVQ